MPKVTGLRLTQANLAALENRLHLAAIPALEELGDAVADRMREKVRKDTHRLEGSIHREKVEVDYLKNRATVRIGPGRKEFWARFLEFGTRLMGSFPFIRPARDETRKEVKPRMKRRLKGALKRG